MLTADESRQTSTVHSVNLGSKLLQEIDMNNKTLLTTVSALLMFSAANAHAQNTPCSGKKGGISHCSGSKFVCNDGSISQSKKTCSGYSSEGSSSSKNDDAVSETTSDDSKKPKAPATSN
mgnify:CR=1 FL=1